MSLLIEAGRILRNTAGRRQDYPRDISERRPDFSERLSGLLGCVRPLERFDRALCASDGLSVVPESDGGIGVARQLRHEAHFDTLSLQRRYECMPCAVRGHHGQIEAPERRDPEPPAEIPVDEVAHLPRCAAEATAAAVRVQGIRGGAHRDAGDTPTATPSVGCEARRP
jgi:hypothetical protein